MTDRAHNKKTIGVRPEHDPLPSRLWRYTRFGLSYLAYVNRPALWPAIGRKVCDKLAGRIPGPRELEAMHQEAKAWCAPRQIPTAEGLKKLGVGDMLNIRTQYKDVFDASQARAGAVPVWVGGGSNLDLLYTLCRHFKPKTIVETGVANGWSSLSFLLYLHERQGGSLHSVDLPLLELHNDRWVGVAVPENLKDKWTLHRMADREALPRIVKTNPVLDMVYYDSDKSIEGRRFAYPLLWKHLKPGGAFVSDDVDDNMGFAEFCRSLGLEPVIVKEEGSNPQGILIKPL